MFFKQSNDQDNAVASQAPSQDVVFDAGAQDFEDKVIKASMEKPVIAYFTATWCGPCKQLGPILEKAVRAAGGAVAMAKIDLDQNQDLAAALRIQSVPTIFGFFQGRPVDAFQGAVPESQVQEFINKLTQAARDGQPDALDIPEALKGAAQAMAENQHGPAQQIYAQILQQDPKNIEAYVGLVRVYIAADHIEEATAMVENAPEDIQKEARFEEAKTALEMATMKPDGSVEDLMGKIASKPDDHQSRYDLAMAQFAAGQKQEAMDSLLEIIERNAKWNEEAARVQLLKFFEAVGQSDPITIEARKRLSSILFS